MLGFGSQVFSTARLQFLWYVVCQPRGWLNFCEIHRD
jgi:hypothetical protein